ncbi:MAG TPA: hypothetical protein VK673_04635 [Chthoniobacterales bacterium]|jgi:hypothetical protein|nr:hypothetical protein [Chthoniobacterales bacterium]
MKLSAADNQDVEARGDAAQLLLGGIDGSAEERWIVGKLLGRLRFTEIHFV